MRRRASIIVSLIENKAALDSNLISIFLPE